MDMPSYPARPINGGPLERARPKTGTWMYEPKLNGWRAIIHAPSGRMYNRHGERLSIEECFKPALDILANADVPEWLDCEALERRLQLGRGSLVIFDYLPSPKQRKDTYTDRKALLLNRLKALPSWKPWQFGAPVQNALYTLEGFIPEVIDELYITLQSENRAVGASLYEGLVAKRADAPYPVQLRSASEETTHWVKHRWAF